MPSGGTGSGGSTTGSGGHATGGSSSGGSTGSSGGSTGSSGGSTGTGGITASGGTTGSGGTPASGGTTGSGGNHASGGTTGSGGTTASGGAGGNHASGGTTGSGGTPASGGAGGASTGTGGTTSTGSGGSSGAGVFFSDDFEADTSGMQPAGWDNIIAYNYKTTNPMGSLTAVADATHTHGGKMAVHFKSDGGMVFLERPLPANTKHLFVRAYFYMTRQLGMGPSGANHNSLLGISMEPNDANNEVRFGEIKGAVGTNVVPSDDIAPVMAKWNGPPIISANTWHCIEVEFDGSATYNTLNAWSDGTLVHSITQGSDWAHAPPGEPANWMSGMFNTFFLGWQSFDGPPSANDIWVDDLVLGSARIGCN